MRDALKLPLLAAAVMATGPSLDLWPPLSPRFAERAWSFTPNSSYLGRNHGRVNKNAAKQAAAKRARKITRRKS